MSDLQRGATFQDGGSGTAAQLHQLVDNGIILPSFISSKSVAAPASGDSFVFYKTSDQTLRRVTLANLIAAFPRGGDAAQFALRKLGQQSGMAAAGNDPRFPTRLHGIRKANFDQPDTSATAADLTPASVALAGATQIDWDAGDVFSDSLTANKTYTFAHVRNGRVITVALRLNGHTVTWPSLLGAAPTINASATVHYFTFIKTALGTSGTVVAL